MITLSFSGLKNLECPFRFKATQVDRTHKEPPTPEMELGKAVHEHIEAILKGIDSPSPPSTIDPDLFRELMATWRASEFFGDRRKNETVEHKLAINSDLDHVEFADPNAVFRGVIDYAYLDENRTQVIVDWKTGYWEVDPKQMQYYAAMMSAGLEVPFQVETVVYNIANNKITRRTYDQDECRQTLLDLLELSRRVNAMTEWPAVPCKLCDRCTVPGCPAREQIALALVAADQSPALRRVPTEITTQQEAEKALSFVLFAESIVGQVKDLLRGYVTDNGPIYAAGKVAQLQSRETWKPKDLATLVKALAAYGAPKETIWENLSLTQAALNKIVKKANLAKRLPFLLSMIEVKESKTFSITNDKAI